MSLVCKSDVGANLYSVMDVEILLSEPGKLYEVFVSVFKTYEQKIFQATVSKKVVLALSKLPVED